MKEGEIVQYDFEVYADDTLIATTIQDLAKEREIEVEDHDYAPRYSISGMDGPFPGIKEAILQAEKGGEAEFEVSPKEGFGERNPRNIDYRRYVDIARIAQAQEKEVDRGVTLEIDGRTAIITLVTPARVRIDYNHEYAGMKIRSKVTILDIPSERDDIVLAILEMNVGGSEDFEFSEEDGILSIKVPSAISLGDTWSTQKLRIVTQLRKHTGIRHIRYIEEFFQKTEAFDEPEINVEVGDEGSSEMAEEGSSEMAEEGSSEMAEEGSSEMADEGSSGMADEGSSEMAEEGSSGMAEELPPKDFKDDGEAGSGSVGDEDLPSVDEDTKIPEEAGSDAAVAEPEEE